MVMTEMFDKLKSLQNILGRKYRLESLIEKAPKELSTQDESLASMKKDYIQASQNYETIKSKVYDLKTQLDEVVKLREDGEKHMDAITTHREYEALEKQINEATLREDEIRKTLQREEKSLAAINDELKTSEAIIQSQEESLRESKAKLDEEIGGYKTELENLNKMESEVLPGLDQEVLFKFQRIIRRNSNGIVPVKSGVCTGCNMILPAQFANEVRQGEDVLFCPYCSRILFHEDVHEGEDETYLEAGSLAGIDFDADDISDETEENEEDSDFFDEDTDDSAEMSMIDDSDDEDFEDSED